MESLLGDRTAASAPRIPRRAELLRLPLEFRGDALRALAAVGDLPHPFALTGRWAGGGAVVGADPRRLLRADEDPFAALDDLPSLDAPRPGAVGGGWFGYLGYQLGRRVERLPPPPPRPAEIPDFHLAYYDMVLHQDAAGGWWLEALRDADGDPDLDARLDALRARIRDAAPDGGGTGEPQPAIFRAAPPGHAGHRWAVAEAVERIAAGDLFQVNLGLRLEAAGAFDPLALYTRAARSLQPAYGSVFATAWGGMVSLSPELFLRRRGREVVTGPIKGTVARPSDGAGAERAVLLGSAKDAAEHVMIVDLMRNDLGRVCEYGSVSRHENRRIEAHPGVWHLVSDVAGTLRPGVGDGELVRASFPPGSVTGAPKVQSMRLISELEGSGRELYTGALGFASPAAGLELSVGIRTFELGRRSIWLGAGGGIVADSDPDAELREALAKAAPLVAAIGAAIAEEAAPPVRCARTDLPRATAVAGAARPDPGEGVMETILVRAGEPVGLSAHLARLRASVEFLYGATLPADLPDRARGAARGHHDVRLRLVATPTSTGVRVACETAPLTDAVDAVSLSPVVLPGGLGAHKWRDRRLLEALARRTAPAVPLLLDSDGSVLEAAWANVWVQDGGGHRTPPADGRLLPGVARARRLAQLRAAGVAVREVCLSLADLEAGDVYLTSSLRAPTPAALAATVRGEAV